MGLLLPNEGRILIASESGGYNVDAIDLANNLAVNRTYLDVREITVEHVLIPVDTPRIRGSASSEAHGIVLDAQRVTMTLPFTGAINVGTTEYPQYAPLLKAAGMSETLVGGTSATYKPSTGQQDAVTLYYWQRDSEAYTFRLRYLTGVRGQISSLVCNLDSEAVFTFEGTAANLPDNTGDTANFQGGISEDLAYFDANCLIDLDKTGAAIIYTGTEEYSDDPKFIIAGMTVSLDGQTCVCSSVQINFPRTVKVVRAVTGNPTTVKVLSLALPATIDLVLDEGDAGYEKVLDRLPTATEVPLVITLTNGTGNDQVVFTFPKAQIAGPITQSDQGGTVAHSLSCIARGDFAADICGDNDYTMVYSQAP